jgi:acetyltransferase-like isoleucine patch superfamily enzyme
MAYYTDEELKAMGFKAIGEDVKISTKTSLYYPEDIEIGDHSRIDDFCLVSGKIKIGKHVHITPYCNLAGGEKGIVMEDFSTLAYGVNVFTQSDDYLGYAMTNSTVPAQYKNEKKEPIRIGRHVIVGAGSCIMPGVTLSEGTSVGAMSLVTRSTEPWKVYVGIPAKPMKDRKKELLDKEKAFLQEMKEE